MGAWVQTECFIAIDLKSFYASVECVERGLNPLTANLVVADESRTDGTICLAVSPSLKACGISGRARLFEVKQRVSEINVYRRQRHEPELEFITAVPRMALYIDYSARVNAVYLKYIAPEDIHVYSVDEVFIDATNYLKFYKCTAHELAMRIIRDVLRTTGITATAGIGTNMYLCKIAMDIVAKHMPADEDGVRIAELDEMTYRRTLWTHRPLTDFWRMGKGIVSRLAPYGMYTMGDIARQSVKDENLLYRLFGINAELIIDHAWGWEPCTMAMVKAYKPETNSLSSGQVLPRPYGHDEGRIVVSEMADNLAMSLFDKRLTTSKVTMTISADTGHVHGTAPLPYHTYSSSLIIDAALKVYDRIACKVRNIRRINITLGDAIDEDRAKRMNRPGEGGMPVQLELFEQSGSEKAENEETKRERARMKALSDIRHAFGKNALLKGISFEEGATARERNGQIGGHRA